MIVFPGMLVDAAVQAGIKVPDDVDSIDNMTFDTMEYPHFLVFCIVQLARPVAYHGEHWDNAKVIARVPEDRIRLVTIEDLINDGLSIVF